MLDDCPSVVKNPLVLVQTTFVKKMVSGLSLVSV